MNILESLLYGLISGLTEFLPISSSAHQQLLNTFFGQNKPDPIQNLFVHVALIIVALTCCRGTIDQLRRQRTRVHSYTSGSTLELRFLKNAIAPFMIVYLALIYSVRIEANLSWIALFSLVNGIILFLQGRMMQGNKDERFMSVLDSIMVGTCGALSAFSGISRIAAMLTVLTARGVSKQKAMNWVILLTIPALVLLAGIDLLNIISGIGNSHFSGNFFGYIFSAVGAYTAGYFGISLIKSLSMQKDYSGFGYYSCGVSLFSFILYLTVV
jgi:undecaprenyl-diphosphatase